MSIVTWLLAGGLTGWAACAYMGTRHSQAFIFNLTVAVIGAAVGNWALAPTLGIEPGFNAFGVIVGAVCGAFLLVVVHFVQRRITG
jgi:uncharacterized membrane protein YeaQ/YmgE (transglycosylase-associated protein family)